MKSASSETQAFILHARPYRETSQILQLFSQDLGRFSIIAKGVKGKASQAKKAILQPFINLNITYAGKSDLKTLVQCEVEKSYGHIHQWQGKRLACGYYANELILRGCPEDTSHPYLFEAYHQLLTELLVEGEEASLATASALRNFEVALLTEMGVAPDWEFDTDGALIEPQSDYELVLGHGFKRVDSQETSGSSYYLYRGESILSLMNRTYRTELLKSCQHITRRLLHEIIGNKPLQSRKLWQHSR